MAINNGLYTSETDKWNTPKCVINDLTQAFDWSVDVCASSANVCANYYDEQANGLAQDWRDLCWMNPPYGRGIGAWMEKAKDSAANGATVVCLVPARTDTKWWQSNVPFASLVVFIRGRLKFGEATNSAPFPSAFVVFGSISGTQAALLAAYGWTVAGGA